MASDKLLQSAASEEALCEEVVREHVSGFACQGQSCNPEERVVVDWFHGLPLPQDSYSLMVGLDVLLDDLFRPFIMRRALRSWRVILCLLTGFFGSTFSGSALAACNCEMAKG